MVIVVISVRFKRIMSILSQYENYHLIKRVGPKLFYYADGDTTHLIRNTKKIIVDVMGVMTVFEVYGIYNGMIDFESQEVVVTNSQPDTEVSVEEKTTIIEMMKRLGL